MQEVPGCGKRWENEGGVGYVQGMLREAMNAKEKEKENKRERKRTREKERDKDRLLESTAECWKEKDST